jgi:hypothetical protein
LEGPQRKANSTRAREGRRRATARRGARDGEGKGDIASGGARGPQEGKQEEDKEGQVEEGSHEKGEALEGPPTKLPSDGEDEECAICFLGFQEEDGEKEAVLLLECGHRFHRQCMHLWVNKCCDKGFEATCPMCRANIRY